MRYRYRRIYAAPGEGWKRFLYITFDMIWQMLALLIVCSICCGVMERTDNSRSTCIKRMLRMRSWLLIFIEDAKLKNGRQLPIVPYGLTV